MGLAKVTKELKNTAAVLRLPVKEKSPFKYLCSYRQNNGTNNLQCE